MPTPLMSPPDGNLDRREPVALIADGSVELDLPDVWGHGSFPASDPPANW